MERLRLIEEPKDGILTIRLPNELKSKKKLEVIVTPYEENLTDQSRLDIGQYYGIWKKLPILPEEVSREMRESWERII